MNCAEAREQAPELALGTLGGAERAEVILHVNGCARCQAYVDEFTEVADALPLLAPEAEPSPGFEDRVLAAIDAPNHHTEEFPSSFYPRAASPGHLNLEGRFPEATQRELALRGHRVQMGETWSGGRLAACAREETPEGRILKAGANPRGMQSYAAGR